MSPVAYLGDAPRGEELFAFGAGRSVDIAGPGRFEQMAAQCSQLTEHRQELGIGGLDPAEAQSLPWAVIGFAFSESLPRARPWSGWPAAWLYVPETLVFRGDRGTRVIVQSCPAPAPEARGRAGATSSVPPGDRLHFERMVHASVNDIDRGVLDKVVLARCADLDAPPGVQFDGLSTARAMQSAHPHGTTFAIDRGVDGCFVGATPETLACVRRGRLTTSALAGTAAAGAEASLMRSAKDRREHALVVEAMHGALLPLCRSLEVATRPRLRPAGAAVHLETPISARLRDGVDLLAVARALHPTPALGGWPLRAAAETIAAREQLDRGWYGGPLGWLAPNGDGVLVVAIRCALVQRRFARAFAGAGIVAGSRPELEWHETELKLQGIRAALQTTKGEAA